MSGWPLLDALDERTRRDVLQAMRRRRYARNEVVFHEGDPADSLHLVQRGHLSVRTTTPRGDTAMLNVLGPGDVFGELALVSPAPRSATVRALDAAETLALHRTDLDDLRATRPEVDRVLLAMLAERVRSLSDALRDTMFTPVPRRVAQVLGRMAATFESDVVPLTQEDLAGLCGTTRQTVNEVLAELTARGVVEVTRGRVRIVDVDGLARAGR